MWESKEGVLGLPGASLEGDTPSLRPCSSPGCHHHCGGSGARTWLPALLLTGTFSAFATSPAPDWLVGCYPTPSMVVVATGVGVGGQNGGSETQPLMPEESDFKDATFLPLSPSQGIP